ncbi:UNVERIFIED_CONTAM: Bacterial surface proteins containing Ig-like domains [Acetivibrio alkalicellulosi]
MKKQMIKIVILIILIFQINIYAQESLEVQTNNETIVEDVQEPKDNDKEYIKVTDLDLADYQMEMERGQRQLLMVTVLPLDATDKRVKYSSNNENVATINELGRITAVRTGTAVITIEGADDVKKQINIRIINPPSSYVSVEGIDIGEYLTEMRVGTSQIVMATVYPANANDSKVQYESSNEKVATISGAGRITAVSEGKTLIKAKAGGKEAYFTLNIIPENKVKEIDLGDYRNEMYVNETQLIMPAIFPTDAVNAGFTYESSNKKVAVINALGRITANAEGVSVITVTAGDIKKQFTLTVSKKTEAKAKEIDLGDYQKDMRVGDSQMIMPSVLPREATGDFKFDSSNKSVATINSFGRINALLEGETNISVSIDGISKSFLLKVEERKDNSVTDIEIGDYDEEMEEGKTQSISAKVLPQDAENAKIEYLSSNKKVATISSTGEIKALEKGSTIITIKAGDVTKQVKISVVVKTTKIDVNKNFLVLKEGEVFQLECKVFPKEANQKIKYTATDTSVISVDNNGLITALKTGEAAVILSNGYSQGAVNIIVNTDRVIIHEEVVVLASDGLKNDNFKEFDEEVIVIDSRDFSVVSSDLLKHIYETKGQLIVEGDKYKINLNGNNVVNFNNEVLTDIEYREENEGISIYINEGKNLPGKVTIFMIDDKFQDYKYLYLYNEVKNKYELLNNLIEKGTIETNVAGKYLLTENKLNTLGINLIFVLIALLSIIATGVLYIFTKKKYWFW